MPINTVIIITDNITKTGSSAPFASNSLASKYLKGVIYFRFVKLAFKSISIDSKYVVNNTPVAADAVSYTHLTLPTNREV